MVKRNPPGYWTKVRVIDDARRFQYQAQWIKGSPTPYSVAKKNGWVKEACAHMTSPKVPMGHWTLESLRSDAQKYLTKGSWREANPSAYVTAKQKGVLAECCGHMLELKKPNGYWTKTRCLASAMHFTTIQSWALGDSPAYDAAKRSGWIDDATAHMVRIFSHGEHTIYTFLLQHDVKFVYQKRFIELKDKSYLPFDFFLPKYNLVIEYHGRQHFETSKSSMFRKYIADMQRRDALKEAFAKNTGLEYLQIVVQKICEIEGSLVNRMQEIAQKLGSPLQLCRRELTSEEQNKLANLGVWTKEAVLADARRFATKTEWNKSDSAGAQVARKNGWFESATAHMTSTQVSKGHWTKDRVIEDARNYKSKIGWISASASAYQTAVANGWIAQATAHMTRPVYKHAKPRGYWTKERVIEDSQKYSTSREWRVSSRLAHRHASEKGWLFEAIAHMTT